MIDNQRTRVEKAAKNYPENLRSAPRWYNSYDQFRIVPYSKNPSIMNESVERKRVIIIGAGASGIAAATCLYENGIEDIIVLEAENRIGGRVRTVDIENGVLEMGAQWIHGEKSNVVYELASSRNLTCDSSPFETLRFARSSGEIIENESACRMLKICWSLIEPQISKSDFVSFKNCGEFHLHLLKTEFDKNENSSISDDIKSELVEFCHQIVNSYEGSGSWFDTSITQFMEYELCEGNPTIMWNEVGYRSLFNILMEKSQKLSKGGFQDNVISLNTEVERISFENDGSSVMIECSNGRKIHADHVIITVSVGVLQEMRTKLFENIPLPKIKVDSIDNLTLGTVDKIYLEFPEKWWPAENDGFGFLWTKDDREDYVQKGLGWIVDMFAVIEVPFAPNILCGWICGDSARIMEGLDEQFVLKMVMQVLRKFLSKKWKIPDAIRIIRSTWYSNKHFRGSYSYRSLKTEAAQVSASTLSDPVNNENGVPVLLFAGEATSPRHYSTVHGAVESGWREADRLIQFIKKDPASLLEKLHLHS